IVTFLYTPFSASLMKSSIGLLNAFRVYWVFCRLMFTQGLTHFRDEKIIDKLESIAGKGFNEKEFIGMIEKPQFIMYGLSVGFFAARFLYNLFWGVKHVLFPSKEEQASTYWERLKFEFSKRHVSAANDLSWGLVNLFTNYPRLLNVSVPLASWLTAGFLFFDFLLVIWQFELASRDFYRQKAIYKKNIEELSKKYEDEIYIREQELNALPPEAQDARDRINKELEILRAKEAQRPMLLEMEIKKLQLGG
ncbi:MAG: hypothetical protein WCR08_13975, partial [Gammaproteobacteria bacterium]